MFAQRAGALLPQRLLLPRLPQGDSTRPGPLGRGARPAQREGLADCSHVGSQGATGRLPRLSPALAGDDPALHSGGAGPGSSTTPLQGRLWQISAPVPPKTKTRPAAPIGPRPQQLLTREAPGFRRRAFSRGSPCDPRGSSPHPAPALRPVRPAPCPVLSPPPPPRTPGNVNGLPLRPQRRSRVSDSALRRMSSRAR